MFAEEEVVYATAGDVELKLDIIRPAQSTARTAVIFLHGGSWREGSKDAMRPAARLLAEHGFVGLPTQYRLTGQAPWPAQIHDVKAAICWTRRNADRLEIEPERIVLWGSSAGAHLALLAAGTPGHSTFDPRGVGPTEVAGVVAVHPPTTLFMPGDRPAHASDAANLMGKAATVTRARAASPTTYVKADFPPSLFLHGSSDVLAPHAASQWMYDALIAAGAPAELHLFHGHNHGFADLPSMAAPIAAEAALFLDRMVVDPARHQAEIETHGMFSAAAVARRAAG